MTTDVTDAAVMHVRWSRIPTRPEKIERPSRQKADTYSDTVYRTQEKLYERLRAPSVGGLGLSRKEEEVFTKEIL